MGRLNTGRTAYAYRVHTGATLGCSVRILGAVVAAHVFIIWTLCATTTSVQRPPIYQKFPAVVMLTNNPSRVSPDRGMRPIDIVVLQESGDPNMGLPAPSLIFFDEPNGSAVSIAPRLLDTNPPDVLPFARKAGLLPGESAVVVLNVEILPDGRIGQVRVDVSSGSRQVDDAAMDYVRQLVWLPGRLHGVDETTWVRQGVRLAV